MSGKTSYAPEFPTEEQLRAYGDFAFLYLRSDHHRKVPMEAARLAIQPPIDRMQFHLFRFEGVPRYGVTWAFLSPEAERKLLTQAALLPAEWNSGPQMWVIEIIAPYGQGTAAQVVKWLKNNLGENVSSVRYMRVDAQHKTRKILEISRIKGTRWGARYIPVSTLINGE